MAVYLNLLFVALFCVAINGFTAKHNIINNGNGDKLSFLQQRNAGQFLLAKKLVEQFTTRFEKNFQDMSISESMGVTLIPPVVDDPLTLLPASEAIDVQIPNLLTLTGSVGLTSGTKVWGLSKMKDDFMVSIKPTIGMTDLYWDFSLPLVSIEGEYEMDLTATSTAPDQENPIPHEITGSGIFKANASQLSLRLYGRMKTFGMMSMESVSIDIGFCDLAMDGSEASVDKEPINWSNATDKLQDWVDNVWNEKTRPIVEEMVRCSISHYIARCLFHEVLLGINPSCYNKYLKGECFLIPNDAEGGFISKSTGGRASERCSVPTIPTTIAPPTSTSTNIPTTMATPTSTDTATGSTDTQPTTTDKEDGGSTSTPRSSTVTTEKSSASPSIVGVTVASILLMGLFITVLL